MSLLGIIQGVSSARNEMLQAVGVVAWPVSREQLDTLVRKRRVHLDESLGGQVESHPLKGNHDGHIGGQSHVKS